MSSIATVLAGAGVAGVALSGLAAPAVAAPASAQLAPVCTLTVTSLEAKELQEPPKDEIALKLGNKAFKVGDFRDNDIKSGTAMGNPSVDFINPVNVKVIELDFPSADDTLGSFNQSCVAGNYTKQATNFGSLYVLKYTVTVDA